MTILYLVRHGETVDNVHQIMQGQTEGRLTENGVQQAVELAARLASEPIDAFVSSDLRRAVDTCKELAAPHGKMMATTPLLRERDWGSFTGCFIPDLKGVAWPDDIESLESLMQRTSSFLGYIKETYPNQRVVAVGHGIINKAIQAVFFHKQMHEVERMANCEVRILEIED
jgi:probable phosphoglycerate mutase